MNNQIAKSQEKSGFTGSKSGFYYFFGKSQDYKGHSQEKSGISNWLAQLKQNKLCKIK